MVTLVGARPDLLPESQILAPALEKSGLTGALR